MKEKVANSLSWTKPLLLDEGIRAVICMLPMVYGMATGQMNIISALGQGGFYFSYLALPQTRGRRLLMGLFLITIGLGFYLIGGNVVFNPWLSFIITFMVGATLVFLTSWKMLGLMAFSFISIYSAGLNAGSPESVHNSYFAFIASIGWAAFISLLPIWKGTPAKEQKEENILSLTETSIRMGFATSIALFVANLFDLAKLGWAPSGAANVIRFDQDTSKLRALFRMIGTIGGCAIVLIAVFVTTNPMYLATLTLVLAFINGLTKATKWGQLVIWYTATILILYGLNDINMTPILALQRIGYNLIGVIIGVLFSLYSFPFIFKRLEKIYNENIKNSVLLK